MCRTIEFVVEISRCRAPLHRSTTEALRPAADVELYSSTALSSSTALQRSTLYILYTLPQPGAYPVFLTQAGAETNLRGVAAYAARWGGVGRTTGIGFSRSPSLQRAPSNPPALGLGFDAWGHTRPLPRNSETSRGSRTEKGQLRALTVAGGEIFSNTKQL